MIIKTTHFSKLHRTTDVNKNKNKTKMGRGGGGGGVGGRGRVFSLCFKPTRGDMVHGCVVYTKRDMVHGCIACTQRAETAAVSRYTVCWPYLVTSSLLSFTHLPPLGLCTKYCV